MAARHYTEVDAFAQGSQQYHTGPNTDWYGDPSRHDGRFAINESMNRHPDWYNYSTWYDDPSRHDGRFAINDSKNRRPIETWHDDTPMSDEGYDAIVQVCQPSVPQHNRGMEDIRELFQIFESEITDEELLSLASHGYSDPVRLIHLCTKPARAIYDAMCTSVAI
jgi:hypothetical protein